MTASPSSVTVGGAAVLKATAHLSDGTTQDVSSGTLYTLSDQTLATVVNGALTAKAAGTVTVQAAYVEVAPAGSSPASATTTPQSLTASTQVTINAPGSAGATNVPVLSWSTPAAITYGAALGAAQLNATANVPGTFTYSPAAGTVVKAGTQTLTVIFTPSDTKTYSSVTGSTQLSVAQATPVISWAAPAAISSGTALSAAQLNATANVPGTFTYSPAAGNIPASGTQALTATFTPADATDYATATAHNAVTVNAGSSSAQGSVISWAAPAAIPYGTALGSGQLNATANVPGTFTYSPAAGTVLKAGNQTLTVLFTPADTQTYSSATRSVQLSVTQATPVITWAAPASITAGTALTAAQLNATANTPGTFTYSPAAGAVLSAGTQALTAIFSPADATDYTTATAHNTITVGASTPPPVTAPVTTPVSSPILPTPVSCGGPTINLNPGMSQSTLQTTIANAPTCSLIVFGAGTYNITGQLGIPCKNLQITGPVAATPTAILSASFQNGDIFAYGSPCTNAGSVNYLHFENTGGVYFSVGNNGNFLFQYNEVTNLPATAGLFFDGSLSTTLSNVVVEHNTFGDPSSCSAVFATPTDEGGYCAGIIASQGTINSITILYNKFIHVEEGIHFNQLASWAVGNKNSVCISCDIEYNYITNYHRIGIEIQVSTPTDAVLIKHNSITDPIASSWGTFAVSMACCEWTSIMGTVGHSPGFIFDDNVLIASLPTGSECPPFGVEFWGTGSQGTNSLIQGTFCNGYTYGYGSGSWQISNNDICGPNYGNSNYISNEEGLTQPPIQSGNTTGKTCSSVSSTAPAISPAGGSFSGSQTVTLSDTHDNTGIWYTTDGSTPVPGSGTAQYYTAPFTVSGNTTVKAVGMWGSPNQPVSYPSGYGYTPSSVVTASFVSGAVTKAPAARLSAVTEQPQAVETATVQALTISPAAPELTIGSTTQLKALATLSDGSTRDVTAEVVWKSSDMRTILASPAGTLTALASGKAMLTGSYLGQQTAVLATSTVGDLAWDGPLVITEGGTYSGNWQSTDSSIPAVTIATTAPVVLEGAHMRGAGNLIQVQVPGAHLTVRNSLGVALPATQKGQSNGAFLDAGTPARLDVENNYLEDVRSGVLLHGYSGSYSENETIIIRGNRARNLNGRLSDGQGGYLPGKAADRVSSRFVELNNVQAVPGIDLGWNEVINYPALSLVSDVIDIYRSSGTLNQPLEVHDSYIQGAYPNQPATDAYSGGGIKIDGSADDTQQTASAFTVVHDNQVIGTVSYGIAFAAGHDNVAVNNRVLSSGVLADGTRIASQQVGLAIAPVQAGTYNNTMHDNLVGWNCWSAACRQTGFRRDEYFPAAPGDYSSNSTVQAQQISYGMEESEYGIWLSKLAGAGIQIGPSF